MLILWQHEQIYMNIDLVRLVTFNVKINIQTNNELLSQN